MKGNYPFAVLHEAKTKTIKDAAILAQKLSKEAMNVREALLYVQAVVKTDGHPNLTDLYGETK